MLQLWLLAIPCLASMLVATLFSVWIIATGILGKVLSWFVGEEAAKAALLNPPVFIISLTVKYDREVTPAERELVRAIAASLHCPLPR